MSPADGLPPLRDVIKRYGLRARKSLGQNFLLDFNLTNRIARAAGPFEGVTVVEIGPGPGVAKAVDELFTARRETLDALNQTVFADINLMTRIDGHRSRKSQQAGVRAVNPPLGDQFAIG